MQRFGMPVSAHLYGAGKTALLRHYVNQLPVVRQQVLSSLPCEHGLEQYAKEQLEMMTEAKTFIVTPGTGDPLYAMETLIHALVSKCDVPFPQSSASLASTLRLLTTEARENTRSFLGWMRLVLLNPTSHTKNCEMSLLGLYCKK
ncbi:hypothetical protein QOT17_014673 [Balamuthia mandrillaris]